MIFNTAYAQASGGGESVIGSLLPLVFIVILFYFLLIRPQQKRAKEHRQMLGELAVGDEVITDAGIMGKVADIKDSEQRVTLDLGNSRVVFQKGAVRSILPKGTLD